MRKRRAAQRAEALRLSEAMLEEDAAKFDAFLKDNDAAVQDAQRRADAETAARQVKVRVHPFGCSGLRCHCVARIPAIRA